MLLEQHELPGMYFIHPFSVHIAKFRNHPCARQKIQPQEQQNKDKNKIKISILLLLLNAMYIVYFFLFFVLINFANYTNRRTLNLEEDMNAELLTKYKGRVEKECRERCAEVLKLLDDHLLPKYKGQNNESEVFFAKMAGDYYRYLAEFSNTDETAKNANEDGVKAKEYYDRAMDVAKDNLAETHPTRLGLALNFSVCYYEILKEPEKACEMAKNAFDAAINKLDTLNDASYKDSTLIMQLLRDNLTLWTCMCLLFIFILLCAFCFLAFFFCFGLLPKRLWCSFSMVIAQDDGDE